jgi:hypothetical protein
VSRKTLTTSSRTSRASKGSRCASFLGMPLPQACKMPLSRSSGCSPPRRRALGTQLPWESSGSSGRPETVGCSTESPSPRRHCCSAGRAPKTLGVSCQSEDRCPTTFELVSFRAYVNLFFRLALALLIPLL